MKSNGMFPLAVLSVLSMMPFAAAQADNGGNATSNGLGQGSQNGPMPGTNPPPAAQKSQYGQGAPTSSLSPNAMTPRANPNGQSLPQGVNAFSNSIKNGSAPANSGPLDPNNPK